MMFAGTDRRQWAQIPSLIILKVEMTASQLGPGVSVTVKIQSVVYNTSTKINKWAKTISLYQTSPTQLLYCYR